MSTPRKKKTPAQPETTTQEAPRDEMAETLIAAELVPNAYVLDLNGSLTVPHTMELPAPWNLSSRMFRFPIVVSGQAADGTRRIMLRHPRLAEHPFAQQVAAAIGRPLDVTDAHGWDGLNTGQWWHAVDLVSDGLWRDLLTTADFTTPEDIAGAVAYGLTYLDRQGEKKGKAAISTADAREVMRFIGSDEPSNRVAILRTFMKPSPCKQDNGQIAWPINRGRTGRDDEAWELILGIEAGWFTYCRAGFLNWTEAGRDRYSAGDSISYTEASGQAAFAF